MEEPSHLRLAIEGPPPPNDGLDPFDHLPPCERRLPPRELSDVLATSRDRCLPWDGLQGERGRPTAALGRREAMACPLCPRVAEELKALADLHTARLLRVQPAPEFLLEQAFGGRQRALGLCSGAAQHDKVVGPARQTDACCGHLSVKWCEEDIGPQRTGHAALRHPRPRWRPTLAVPHPCPQAIPDSWPPTAVADLLSHHITECVLVDGVQVLPYIGIDDPDVPCGPFPPHVAHRHVGRTPRALPQGTVPPLGLKDRFQALDEGLLAHSIPHRGHPARPAPSVRLRYLDPFHWVGSLRPVSEPAVQEGQIISLAPCQDRHGDLVDTCTASVLCHFLPGALYVLPATPLVKQRVDCLRAWSCP